MKQISLTIVALLFSMIAIAQGNYKVGDKVQARDDYKMWLPAEIMEIKADQYKVHYTGYSDLWDAWVASDRIKSLAPVKVSTAKNNSPSNNSNSTPEMAGNIPKLKGTAWGVQSIYTKGTTPKYNQVHPVYLFCNTGHFEMQTRYALMGTYSVSGNKLTQISDGSDHLKETYTITWNAAEQYLELTSGTLVIRLKYNKKAAC